MNQTVTRFLNSRFAAIALLLAWTPLNALAAESNSVASSIHEIDVVFVLDNSGSMRENDPEFLTRAAVVNFASALAEDPGVDGRIGVVLFDGQSRLVQALTPIRSGETDALLAVSLAELDFSGQRTNSPAGIERALYEFRQNGRPEARRAIVLLTDGKIDTGDTQGDLEAARWLREDLAGESEASGIRIFGIAFTDAADYQLMQALARRTNARYYRAFEATELSNVVDDVLLRIGHDQFFEVTSVDPRPTDSALSDEMASPDVAAAPLPEEERSNFGLFGLLPVAILFVAGTLVWRRRTQTKNRVIPADGLAPKAGAPKAQLLDVTGQIGEVGAAIELAGGRTRIGRDSHSELVIDDDTISSEHAVISVRDGRYWLEDRRSTNGTRLNDQRLEPNQALQLKGGDHIRIADIDLMFVLAGYVPAGETVYLSSATRPPADWRASVDTVVPEASVLSDAQDPVAPAEDSLASQSIPDPLTEPEIEPETEPVASDDREPIEDDAVIVEDASESNPMTEPEPELEPDGGRDYRRCLDYHLERVSEISSAFGAFIATAFDDEIRGALCVAARDITSEARDSGQIQQKVYTFERVRFVICGVPAEMESARTFYVEAYGGFTRMLSEQLQSDSFREDRCETLAVLTFGVGDSPWVSLSIVPDEDKEPRIDLLSYEFLTEEERQELDPSEHTEFSQSGLG